MSTPLPMTFRSPPASCFSSATAFGTSPVIWVEFGQRSGSVEVEATYFEALFKAFARAVDAACQRDPRIAGQLPSTKGRL